MVFTTYLFVFYFLPLVLVSYYALDGLCRQAGASDGRTCLVLNTLLVLRELHLLRLVESLVHLPDAGDHRRELRLRADHRPAGDRPSAELPGRGVRHRREPGHARVLQVFHVPRGQPESGAGLVRGRHGARARDHLADRDLVLHVPCAQLHHRRLSRHGPARPVVRRFRLLHRALPPARRRAHHPLQHGGRSAREPLAYLGEVRFRSHPVHPRLRQEDLAGQSDGPGRGRRVRRRSRSPRRMPGSARWPTRSRSTSISPVIPTWPSAWVG